MKDTERTFVLAGLVVFFLLIMHALPKLHIGATELRRVNILSDLVPEKDDDAGSIIPAPKAPKAETIAKTRSGKAIHFKEVWPKGVEPIVDYSGDAAGGMRHFYDALSRVKTMNRPVRIAYFGDSFIENDIMTADLRELFQKEFGGNGVGWVDLANPINRNSRRTVTQQTSGTREYAIVSKPFDKQRQGIGERYYSVANGAKVSTNAASTFNRFQPHSKTFDVARLFFRTDGSATIGAAIGKQPVRTRTFGPSGSVQMYEVKGHGSQLTYTFNGLSGTFTGFGMAMESNRGVILDCLSMRGSNGLTLKDIPQHTLNDFHRLRPYDLIIVQFGLNVAVAGNPQSIIKLYASHMRQGHHPPQPVVPRRQYPRDEHSRPRRPLGERHHHAQGGEVARGLSAAARRRLPRGLVQLLQGYGRQWSHQAARRPEYGQQGLHPPELRRRSGGGQARLPLVQSRTQQLSSS
jgi:hypothetical protein